jgi:CBS-domain-containing membrane protein
VTLGTETEESTMKRTVSDVMTRSVVSVDRHTPFKEVVRRMLDHRVSGVPVVREDGGVLGVISTGDLILKEDPTFEGDDRWFEGRRHHRDRSKAGGVRAEEIMTTPPLTIRPDATLGEAARMMHDRRVKRLPVVDPGHGTIVGIVSRSDLLKVFLREDAEIADEIRDDVIQRTLWLDASTIRVVVSAGVVTLEGQVERRSLITFIEHLVRSTDGVVAFNNRLSYLEDDSVTSMHPMLPWPDLGSRAAVGDPRHDR